MRQKVTAIIICLLFLAGFGMAANENVVVPYLLKAPAPIEIDGDLTDFSFAFPINFNTNTMLDYMRPVQENWVVEDDEECSGTLYMMYDDDYFYFAAEVVDDAPGYFSEASWAADAIEFYWGNWDIGDAIRGAEEVVGWLDDADTGDYSCQLNISFDAQEDLVIVRAFNYGGGPEILESEETQAQYFLTDTGYILEGKVYLQDLVSASTGNIMDFTGGTRIPFAWSLYDIDESKNSGDFKGYNFNQNGFPAWQGINQGYVGVDVLDTARGDIWDAEGAFDFVAPYVKKLVEPIDIDGDLSEWNFCFPIAMNYEVMGSGFRCVQDGWVCEDNESCSGNLYMMYDDDYFYFAGKVTDDAPGYTSEAAWAADAIEFYMGNWDIGDAIVPAEGTMGWQDDQDSGDYSFQLNISLDADQGQVITSGYYGPPAIIEAAETAYSITDTGYIIEGKILYDDLTSTTTGNYFTFVEGERNPITWSIYDIDESRSSADFQGFAYSKAGFPAYAGPSEGYQYVDIKGIDFIHYLENEISAVADEKPVVPATFELGSYPNPFNPTTNIQFSLNKTVEVSLNIFDVNGRLIQTVFANQSRAAGQYTESVDMSRFASGVYFAVLQQGNTKLSHKMLLVK